jgi:hypothetical protein
MNAALRKAAATDAVEGGPTPTATIAREKHITTGLMIARQKPS